MATRRRASRRGLTGSLTEMQRRLSYLEGRPSPSRLSNHVVTRTTIQPQAVATDQIAFDAVTNDQVAADAIALQQMQNDSVGTSELIADSVTQDELATDSVTDDAIAGDSVGVSELANGAVDTAAIQNDAVTEEKIAADAVTERQIASGAVGNSELANDAVATNNIQNLNITTDKLANGAVTSAKIGTGQVLSSNIGNSQVVTNSINDKAVTGAKIADATIVARNMAFNSVTEAALAGNAVYTNAIQNGAVNSAKIANNSITSADVNGSICTSAAGVSPVVASLTSSGQVRVNAIFGNAFGSFARGNHTHSQYVQTHVHGFTVDGGTHNPTGNGYHAHAGTTRQNNYSSKRYKKEISNHEVTDVSKLLDLELVKFKYKNKYRDLNRGQKWQYGLIAEQVEELGLHELIEYDKDGQPNKVDYALIGLLSLELIKNQQDEIDSLKKQVQRLTETK